MVRHGSTRPFTLLRGEYILSNVYFLILYLQRRWMAVDLYTTGEGSETGTQCLVLLLTPPT